MFPKCIVALGLIHLVSPLQEMRTTGNVAVIRCQDFVIELACHRDVIVSSELSTRKRASLAMSKRDNLLPQPCKVLILADGHIGPLPPPIMPEYILDAVPEDSIIDGGIVLAERWVSIDELFRLSRLQELRETLGVSQ